MTEMPAGSIWYKVNKLSVIRLGLCYPWKQIIFKCFNDALPLKNSISSAVYTRTDGRFWVCVWAGLIITGFGFQTVTRLLNSVRHVT